MWLNLCLAFSLCWAVPFRGRGLAAWAEAFVGNTVQGQEGREVTGLMSQIISRRKKIWKARRMDLVPVTSQALGRALLFASSFNITMRSVYYSHFPGEIMEAQRGKVLHLQTVTQLSSTCCESLHFAVGNTPTNELRKHFWAARANVWLKCETALLANDSSFF